MLKTAPKNIRWLILISLLLLTLMTAARILLFYIFRASGQTVRGALAAFWLGVRYDLREVGIAAVCLLLLGLLRPLNPFISKFGKIFWITVFSIFVFVLLCFYTVDYFHYDYLHQRLNASVLNFLEDAPTSFSMVKQTYPLLIIIPLIFLLTFLIMLLIFKIYKTIDSQNAYKVTTKSQWAWGIPVFIVFAVGVFGRLGQYPLRWSDSFALDDDYMSQLALNPVQNFFSYPWI